MEDKKYHIGFIPTNKRTILEYVRDQRRSIAYTTVLLLAIGRDLPDYELRLYSISTKLLFLSRLIYRGKSGYKKLTLKNYREELFDPYAETKEEVQSVLDYWVKTGGHHIETSIENAQTIYDKMNILGYLWGNYLSCMEEVVFLSEISYALEYVINKTYMKKPEFNNMYSLFPSNYDDYNYTEGIADVFDKIDFAE